MPNCFQGCRDGSVNAVGSTVTDEDFTKTGGEMTKTTQLKPLLQRYWVMLALSWCMEISVGIAISLPGPTLPYLALKVSEPLSRLGFIFTASSLASCATSWLTAVALARPAAGNSRAKLLGLLLGNAALAAALLATPFAQSLAGLIAAQCAAGAGIAVISTVDNMLVIYLFGPVLSRSFSHSLHFCIGLGGFLAPQLARPFLIQMGDVGSDGDICGLSDGDGGCGGNSTMIQNATTGTQLDALKWPYAIVGCLHSICLCGYALLILVNFQLIRHRGNDNNGNVGDIADETKPPSDQTVVTGGCRKWTVVSLFVLFYVLHAGQESGFWSYLYSFGVCSRLCFNPDEAALLNTVFFVGYLVSRGAGVPLSGWARPSVMLLAQLSGCVCATAALAAWGDSVPWVANAGVAAYGLCIAMVFPTGITWLSSKLDVTGSLASTWSVGTYIGASTYPLATGLLISSQVGPIAMMYLAVAVAAAYLIVAIVMMLTARGL